MKKLLFACCVLTLLLPIQAFATAIITISDVAGNVVVSVTGSLNTAGAAVGLSSSSYLPGIIPGGSNWYVASGPGSAFETYDLTGVTLPFGTSTSFFQPNSTSGQPFFIWGVSGALPPKVGVAPGYVSGSAITSGMVLNGTSIATMTLVPGVYNFSIPNDTIQLRIGEVVAPEPGTLSLLGIGIVAGLIVHRRTTR